MNRGKAKVSLLSPDAKPGHSVDTTSSLRLKRNYNVTDATGFDTSIEI